MADKIERFTGGEGESRAALVIAAQNTPKDKSLALQGITGFYRELLLAKLIEEGE